MITYLSSITVEYSLTWVSGWATSQRTLLSRLRTFAPTSLRIVIVVVIVVGVAILTSVESLVTNFLRFVHFGHVKWGAVLVPVGVVTISVDATAVIRVAVVIDRLVKVIVDEVELRGFLADVFLIDWHADQMNLNTNNRRFFLMWSLYEFNSTQISSPCDLDISSFHFICTKYKFVHNTNLYKIQKKVKKIEILGSK